MTMKSFLFYGDLCFLRNESIAIRFFKEKKRIKEEGMLKFLSLDGKGFSTKKSML